MKMKSLFKQAGGTLLEVMAGMVIIGIVAAGTLRIEANNARNAVIDNALVQTIAVQNAARQHRAGTGSWPTNTAQLVSSGKLTSATATSPFGTAYTFSVTGNNLRVSATALNASQARRMAGMLPNGSVSGSSYSFQFQPAGSEASLAGLYSLDGSKALTGNMNAGGHSISNVNTLNAANISGSSITGGSINSTGNISASGAISANGQITGGGFNTSGIISGGTITGTAFNGGSFNGGDVNSSGTVTANAIRSHGNVNAANVFSTGTISGNSLYSNTGITAEGLIRGRQLFLTDNLQAYGHIVTEGTLTAQNGSFGGNVYGRRFIDYDNHSTYFDPSETSVLNNVEVNNNFRVNGLYTEGTGCMNRQIGFNATNDLMICKDGLWKTSAGESQEVYTQGDETSITIGKLVIKMGLSEINNNSQKSVFFRDPFPAGSKITSTCGMSVLRNGGNPAHCTATTGSIRMENNNGSDKDFYWQVIGVIP